MFTSIVKWLHQNKQSHEKKCPQPTTTDVALPSLYGINIIVIADTHGSFGKRYDELLLINDHLKDTDLIVFLGDVFINDYEVFYQNFGSYIKDHNIPVLSVVGNHDDQIMQMQKYIPWTTWLHGKTTVITIPKTGKQLVVGGLSGSIRYKHSDAPLLSHRESVEILDKMPYCDILLTHDKPMFEVPDEEDYDDLCSDAHSGLYGIGKYIDEKCPLLVLHGHIHERYIEKHRDTYIKCCYRCESLQI